MQSSDITPYNSDNVSSSDGILPDGIEPLPEPMLTCYLLGK